MGERKIEYFRAAKRNIDKVNTLGDYTVKYSESRVIKCFETGRTKINCFERIFEELEIERKFILENCNLSGYASTREFIWRYPENYCGLYGRYYCHLLDLAILEIDRIYRLFYSVRLVVDPIAC